MASQLVTAIYLAGYPQAPSGKLIFYQVGTTTPVNVYSDDAASQVITQPVPLDANGRPTTPVYATQPMRMILQDSTGAQLLDIERVNGSVAAVEAVSNAGWPGETSVDAVLTALYTTLGGTDGNFKNTGSGAVQRSVRTKLSELPSVKDWNAKGDGVTDDYAAITAAFTAVNAAGGGTLLFPAGTYVVSNTLALPASVSIRGVNNVASVISNGGSGNTLTMSSLSRALVEDIGITASASITSNGITATSCNYCVFSRVRVTNHRFALTITDNGAAASAFNKVQFCELVPDGNALGRGLLLAGSVSGTGSYVVYGSTFSNPAPSSSAMLYLTGTVSSVSIVGNFSSGTMAKGLWIDSSHTGSKVFAVGNDFSNTTTGAQIDRATGPQLMEFGNAWGAVTDSSDGNLAVIASPFYGVGTAPPRPTGNVYATQTLAGNGTITPDLRKANFYYIKESTGATTVTVATPASGITPFAGQLTMICHNTSAGAVTWTFSGSYIMGAAIAPAAGARIAITFRSDTSVGWYEVNRSAAY